MSKRALYLSAVLLLLLPAACDRETPAPAEEPPHQEPTAEPPQTEDRQQLALTAIGELRETLMGRVMSVATEEGFAQAVVVCKEEAPPLTQNVAETYDLRLGRTSERLRNPDNTAPAWLHELAAQATDGPHFQEAPDGTLRGVAPIRLAEACTACHGHTDQLAEGVPAALARLYPEDQATGYSPGDLRGYFWVEVP